MGLDTRIDDDSENTAFISDSIVLFDGSIANVWSEDNANGTTSLYFSVTNTLGQDILAPIELETPGSITHTFNNARLEQLSDGSLLLTWINTLDTGKRVILAKTIYADGSTVNAEIAITPDDTRSNVADSIQFDDGNIFTVFRNTGWDVKGNLYNFTDGVLGGMLTINNTTSGDQLDPSIKKLITIDGTEKFVVTYSSSNGDSDGWGILAKIFSYDNGSITVEKKRIRCELNNPEYATEW